MREIKFRGKRIDNGEWVYGYYLVAAGMPFISAFAVREPILVVTETVGQFTGLQDKNGKDIYENDVVKTCGSLDPYDNSSDPINATVYWADGSYWLDGTDMGGDEALGSLSAIMQMDGLEVIGNIHEGIE